MRWGLIGLVLLCQMATTRVVASDATELREALLLMRRPAILEPVKAEQSCNSEQCTVDIAQISIETQRGRMTIAGKYPVKTQLQARSKKSGLPAVNWTPVQRFMVSAADQQWGMCLEFSHQGVGSSGTYQRWATIVLIPWHLGKPQPLAYRFIGYRLRCDQLAEAMKVAEISLPTIEPDSPNSADLKLIWHACGHKNCRSFRDNGVAVKAGTNDNVTVVRKLDRVNGSTRKSGH